MTGDTRANFIDGVLTLDLSAINIEDLNSLSISLYTLDGKKLVSWFEGNIQPFMNWSPNVDNNQKIIVRIEFNGKVSSKLINLF